MRKNAEISPESPASYSNSKLFEKKYIIKNPKWEEFLKVQDKKNCKRKGEKATESMGICSNILT
jgi:hypothetical protein